MHFPMNHTQRILARKENIGISEDCQPCFYIFLCESLECWRYKCEVNQVICSMYRNINWRDFPAIPNILFIFIPCIIKIREKQIQLINLGTVPLPWWLAPGQCYIIKPCGKHFLNHDFREAVNLWIGFLEKMYEIFKHKLIIGPEWWWANGFLWKPGCQIVFYL